MRLPLPPVAHLNPLIVGLVAFVFGLTSRQLYYKIKPIIPHRLRMALRRYLAIRQRNENRHCWPILETAATKPEGWPGWPENRRFAFVLTHDIESPTGLERVKQIAEIELSLGFRSSFNFIPEGSYQVPDDLREWLMERGFEVGVHDHRHDGMLYHSWDRFKKSAARINHYLRSWNAVGFRSGFMLRDLRWIGELDVLYDSSTFDTDVFEPQPDGAHTIFPFWVSNPHGGGYVEMPYTLAQDSTLFLVLQEVSVQIWKDKLAWIADRGGMALLNVHPDYASFADEVARWKEFPASLYRQFLQEVKEEYAHQYYHALPREVAGYYIKATAGSPAQAPCLPPGNATLPQGDIAPA